jgi:hypothetical protein
MEVLALNKPTYAQIERLKNINRQVVNHIRDSQGFILVLPATDAIFFRKGHLRLDADSYLYNIIGQVMDWKKASRAKIEGIAVWLTKWDQAMEAAKEIGMDIYAGDKGMARFMDNGFPGISMLIKGLRDEGRVQYFRSYFNIAKRDDGFTDETWPDGSPRIFIKEDPNHYIRFKPDFDGDEYVRFIKWAGSFAK